MITVIIYMVLFLFIMLSVFIPVPFLRNKNNDFRAEILVYLSGDSESARKKLSELIHQSVWYDMTDIYYIYLVNVDNSPAIEELCKIYTKKYSYIKMWG